MSMEKQTDKDKYIYINSIMKNPSLGDGIGYRTVIFLQGCNIYCQGCQNKQTWDIFKGQKIEVDKLANVIREKAFNKKITISGGEPLMQYDGLIKLLEKLKDFDICIYTGHELEDVPKELFKYLKYIKVGPYIESLKTTTKPFVGSKNQKFIKVDKNEQ